MHLYVTLKQNILIPGIIYKTSSYVSVIWQSDLTLSINIAYVHRDHL